LLLAIAVFAIAGAANILSSALTPATSGTTPSVPYSSLVSSVEYILLFAIFGAILGVIGRSLLGKPRAREKQLALADRFQRPSVYTRWAVWGLFALGVILTILGGLSIFFPSSSFIGGLPQAVITLGDGLVFFALWGIVGGVADLLHAYAYADQPLAAPANPWSVTTPTGGGSK
jgi:hypothetical protein